MKFLKNSKNKQTNENQASMSVKLICEELRVLSALYDVQYEQMEDFARWNLPEETALSYIDTFAIFLFYYNRGLINVDEKTISLLYDIEKNFNEAFLLEKRDYDIVWSHKGMENHSFWMAQRDLAEKALTLLKKQFSFETGE